METNREALPDDNEALKALVLVAQAEAAVSRAQLSEDRALIAQLKLTIEKLKRERFGAKAKRTSRLLDQMELQLEDLEASATEDELAAETAAARTTTVAAFERKRPSRQPFPDHLPRERIVVPGPTACSCCGSSRLRKLGEDVTETLEVVPRQWKVIQTVREKFSCPGLRGHQSGASAVPRHLARARRAEPSGDGAVREVRTTLSPTCSGKSSPITPTAVSTNCCLGHTPRPRTASPTWPEDDAYTSAASPRRHPCRRTSPSICRCSHR